MKNKKASMTGALFGLMALMGGASLSHAEVIPPPPSNVGTDIPALYNGPAPSDFDHELVGPVLLLRAGKVDVQEGTVTLPLYKGAMEDGRTVWYILTDTNDEGNANALGLNYSAKLAYANVGRAVRSARLGAGGKLIFSRGTVDFSPNRRLVAGDAPNFFPPKVAEPGSIGDAYYSPLVKIQNAGGAIYNAPMIAFNATAEAITSCDGNHVDHSLVHDRVVKICPSEGTVTLKLVSGFSFAKPVFYLSTETNLPLAAAMESATYAPGLRDVTVGQDDGAFSAVERLFTFVNGPTGTENPQRQGFNSALSDLRSPLNVLGGIPTVSLDYSPLWDLNVGVWTDEAIRLGYRSRLIEEFQILDFARRGFLTSPGGAKYGSSGIIVNCPIVSRFL